MCILPLKSKIICLIAPNYQKLSSLKNRKCYHRNNHKQEQGATINLSVLNCLHCPVISSIAPLNCSADMFLLEQPTPKITIQMIPSVRDINGLNFVFMFMQIYLSKQYLINNKVGRRFNLPMQLFSPKKRKKLLLEKGNLVFLWVFRRFYIVLL